MPSDAWTLLSNSASSASLRATARRAAVVVEVDVLDADAAAAAAPRGCAAEELAEQIAEIEHAGPAALRVYVYAAGARRDPAGSRPRGSASYSLRFFASPSTSYAFEMSLKRDSFALSPPVESGWFALASLRYAFLISSAVALSATPSAL